MAFRVNGKEVNISEGLSVGEFLKEKGILAERVVVEHNLRILDKSLFDSTKILSDDNIEVLSFVGGG
jgi:thiamine biosynthesis protein ThiS